MSKLAIPEMSVTEARRITERIRLAAMSFADAKAKLAQYVDEAREGRAWAVLGFRSWTEYLTDVFSDEPLRLTRDERREIVGQLSDAGMSTRAIAPIVGMSQKTVVKDLQVIPEVSPAPAPADSEEDYSELVNGLEHVVTHVSIDPPVPGAARGPLPVPKKITGIDGKEYSRPEPRAPEEPVKQRRRPLTDAFFDATYDARKKIETLVRLTQDDRFSQNREQVASKHGNDLREIADALADVLRAIQ